MRLTETTIEEIRETIKRLEPKIAKAKRKLEKRTPKRMFPNGLKTVSRFVDFINKDQPHSYNDLETTMVQKEKLIRGGEKASSYKYETKTFFNHDIGKVEEIKIRDYEKGNKPPYSATKNSRKIKSR